MILFTPVTNRMHASSSNKSSLSVPIKQNSQHKFKFTGCAGSKI